MHRNRCLTLGAPLPQRIGRSRGGLTSKIVAELDANGCLVWFMILPDQMYELAGVPDLPEPSVRGA